MRRAFKCRRERGMERDLAVERRQSKGTGNSGQAPVSSEILGWDKTTFRVSWEGKLTSGF